MHTKEFQLLPMQNKITLQKNSIIIKLQNTENCTHTIKILSLYDKISDEVIECNEQKCIYITYFDFSQQDQSSLLKFFFELVSLEKSNLSDEQNQNAIIFTIHTCMQLRKYQQALDFVKNLKQLYQIPTYLILSFLFDTYLRSRDSCYSFLCFMNIFHNSENLAQQLMFLQKLPYNNAQFDLQIVVQQNQDQCILGLLHIFKYQYPIYDDNRIAAIIYFINILLECNLFNTIQNQSILKLIAMIQGIQAQATSISSQLSRLNNVIQQKIQQMKPLKQITLLNLCLQMHLSSSGLLLSVIQLLILSIPTQIKIDLSQDLANILFQNLLPKFMQFNQNLRVANSLSITESIIGLFSTLNIHQNQFIGLLITNFYAQNEFQLTNNNGKEYRDFNKTNQYFVDDVLNLLHLLSVYGHFETSQQIVDDLCLSLLFSFNIKQTHVLKEFEMIEDSGLTTGQIFGVADEIYKFSFKYSPTSTNTFLTTALQLIGQFECDYVGSEALLFQIDITLQHYQETCLQLSIDLDYQILFNLLCALSQWVDYQIYTNYFDLLTKLIALCIYKIQKQQVIKVILTLFKKLSMQSILPQNLLEACISSIVSAEVEEKVDYLLQISQFFTNDYLKIDVQFVAQTIFLYLNAMAMQNEFNMNRLQYIQTVLKSYREIAFGIQQYQYLGQIVAAQLLYCIASSGKLDIIQIFDDCSNDLGSCPTVFYTSLLECIFSAQSLVVQHKQDLDFILLLNLISEYGDDVEIEERIQKISQLTIIESTPSVASAALTSRPQSAPSAQAQQPIYLKITQFKNFPPYTDIDGIKRAVQLPSIPFVFIIPHPTAKENKMFIEVTELINDIGNVDQLQEEVINEFVEQKERPQSSHVAKEPKPQQVPFNQKRPMSAGTQIEVQTAQEAVRVPHIQQKVEYENWEEDGEEENLLEKIYENDEDDM